MQELVEYIVSRLIGDEGTFNVSVSEGEGETVILVSCEKKIVGKIIGKQGRIAKAIRNIVKAAGARDGKKYNVIIEEIAAE